MEGLARATAVRAINLAMIRVQQDLLDDRIGDSRCTLYDAMWALKHIAHPDERRAAVGRYLATTRWEKDTGIALPTEVKYLLCAFALDPELRFHIPGRAGEDEDEDGDPWELTTCPPEGEDFCIRFLDGTRLGETLCEGVIGERDDDGVVEISNDCRTSGVFTKNKCEVDLYHLELPRRRERVRLVGVYRGACRVGPLSPSASFVFHRGSRVRIAAATGVHWYAAWRRGENVARVYVGAKPSGLCASEYAFKDAFRTFCFLFSEEIGVARGLWRSLTGRFGWQLFGNRCTCEDCGRVYAPPALPPPPARRSDSAAASAVSRAHGRGRAAPWRV